MSVPILSFLLIAVLTFFATGIMSYIAMATIIGPWIAPTLVLLTIALFKMIRMKNDTTQNIALIVSSSSLGGIIATAVGFSYPTLYFADEITFNAWMATPWYFAAVLGGLVLTAGAFGVWVANTIEEKLLVEQQLDFPIGQLIHKMIALSQHVRKAYELSIGFISSFVFSFLQDGLLSFKGIIPSSITFFSGTRLGILAIPALRFDMLPLMWAIGYVAGHLIALPLLVGGLSKIFILDPLNVSFFSYIKNSEFVLAFCSGMVIAGAVVGIISYPSHWYKLVRAWIQKPKSRSITHYFAAINKRVLIEGIIVCSLAVFFLTLFHFPFITQGYLLIATWICTYQMAVIAGKIGLAQLGRWATFVMVPALFLFNLSLVQIVFIATFVEISGGVACDILFGRKVARLGAISLSKMKMYQYLGLLSTALCIGTIFWLLISHFHLGSEHLFASRAQARQLLLMAQTFDIYVLALGFIFGYALKWIKLNPLLVLGGLLMPLNNTLGLLFGAFLSYIVADKEEYIPFWSGVFAAGSLWKLIRALI